MTGTDFKFDAEWLADGVIVTMNGDLTAAAAGEMAEISSLGEQAKAILLDFSGVDYVNSGGIALLIGLIRSARARLCPIRARGLSDHYRKIFRMVGLSEYIDVLPD